MGWGGRIRGILREGGFGAGADDGAVVGREGKGSEGNKSAQGAIKTRDLDMRNTRLLVLISLHPTSWHWVF